jgi:hypothetical protein
VFSGTATLALLMPLGPPALAQAVYWQDTGMIGTDHAADEDGDGWIDDVDCDDTRADMYPGAPDEPYDGIDHDCQRNDDYDADKDGYVPTKYWGLDTWPDHNNEIPLSPRGDCDDDDPDIHPGAADSKGNQVDENCDGQDGVADSSCFGSQALVLFLMPLSAWMRRPD